MKALVLTYDKYRPLTEHMIGKYGQLWPQHPFTFRIPYQQLAGKAEPAREYIRCPSGIKQTVLALIDGLDDEEWIYWCIDDKYPVKLDIGGIESIRNWIRRDYDQSVDSILCCRPRKLTKQKRLTGRLLKTGNGTTLLERKNYKCIWIHQFLRVKVLRHLFEAFPDVIPNAKAMDKLKGHVRKPDDHRLYVTKNTMAVFGESTMRGVITENCYRSLQNLGLPLPEWHRDKIAESSIHGKMPGYCTRALRKLFHSPLIKTS
jgi:hypothetical protein